MSSTESQHDYLEYCMAEKGHNLDYIPLCKLVVTEKKTNYTLIASFACT